jgi:UDP-glucose 4-epimerase
LISNGFDVVSLDNLANGFEENLTHGVHNYIGDVCSEKTLKEIFNHHDIGAVCHFAGLISVPDSVKEPLDYYEVNVGGTLSVLRACKHFGVKNFIFSSTATVYDSRESFEVLPEDHPLRPIHPYGKSKFFAEELIRDFKISWDDFNYVILRYFNAAGADFKSRMGQRNPEATHLVKRLVKNYVENQNSLLIYGKGYNTHDGTGVRDYIHVEDLADAHVCALRALQSREVCREFNCGYGEGFSVLDVVEAFGKIVGKTPEYQIVDSRPGDVSRLVSTNSRIQEELGWVPKYGELALILKSALDFEKHLAEIKKNKNA